MTPGTIIAAGYYLTDSERQSLAKWIDAEIAALVEAQWQPIETAPKCGEFLAAIHHGQCGYMVVCAKRIGPGVHDVAEGSCVGWRPEHEHPAFWMPLPAFAAIAKAKQEEPQP